MATHLTTLQSMAGWAGGVGDGVGLGVGDGVGLGVGDGVGLGVGFGAGLVAEAWDDGLAWPWLPLGSIAAKAVPPSDNTTTPISTGSRQRFQNPFAISVPLRLRIH
jgi:hypothetical protein